MTLIKTKYLREQVYIFVSHQPGQSTSDVIILNSTNDDIVAVGSFPRQGTDLHYSLSSR